jgi:hypothetical protein
MIYTFDSTQAGAPVLSGTAGALATVLKVCLVDGFGASAVVSLVVTAGIAKATFAASHPYRVGSVSRIAGATPSPLNGDKTILSVTTNSVTFSAAGVPDGAATGTITSRAAPAGWQDLFPGAQANVLVLKPTAPEASGSVLRLDDTGTTTAKVVGYESMTDVSTGTGPFPMAAQAANYYWPKSDAASTAARRWMLFADERAFAIWISPHGSNQQHGVLFGFGDLASYKSGDAWACMLAGSSSVGVPTTTGAVAECLGYALGSTTAADLFVVRGYAGIGGAVQGKKISAYNTAAAYSGVAAYAANTIPYPNPADNSLRLSGVELLVGASGLRGQIPGVFHTPQVIGSEFQAGMVVEGEGAFAGRSLVCVRVGPPGGTTGVGVAFVDITGPWRSA